MDGIGHNILDSRKERISKDKCIKFKGIAKVKIIYLEFLYPNCPEDRRVVEQLKRDFDSKGCI
jgi:hypothetical protein